MSDRTAPQQLLLSSCSCNSSCSRAAVSSTCPSPKKKGRRNQSHNACLRPQALPCRTAWAAVSGLTLGQLVRAEGWERDPSAVSHCALPTLSKSSGAEKTQPEEHQSRNGPSTIARLCARLFELLVGPQSQDCAHDCSNYWTDDCAHDCPK
jgi:hypothetical protein